MKLKYRFWRMLLELERSLERIGESYGAAICDEEVMQGSRKRYEKRVELLKKEYSKSAH